MSADHKRPLLAFTVVALLCALFVGNALRSEAVVGILRVVESSTVAMAPDLWTGRSAETQREDEAKAAPTRGPRGKDAAPAPAPKAAAAPAGSRGTEKVGRTDRDRGELRTEKARRAPSADGTPTEVVRAPAPRATPAASPKPHVPRPLKPRVVAPKPVTPHVGPTYGRPVTRPVLHGTRPTQPRVLPGDRGAKPVTPARPRLVVPPRAVPTKKVQWRAPHVGVPRGANPGVKASRAKAPGAKVHGAKTPRVRTHRATHRTSRGSATFRR